jgi:hypothetical protein
VLRVQEQDRNRLAARAGCDLVSAILSYWWMCLEASDRISSAAPLRLDHLTGCVSLVHSSCLLKAIPNDLESIQSYFHTEMSAGVSTKAVELEKNMMDAHALPLTPSRQAPRYDQLDTEKASALPDVSDSFAYEFVPPPGFLTPEKHALLKAFHTIQYRLTFKVGVAVDLARDDHPQHGIAHMSNFRA